jgi:hypothetical protein
MSKLLATTGRVALAAGLLMIAAPYAAPPAQAGSAPHQGGMTTGPTIGPHDIYARQIRHDLYPHGGGAPPAYAPDQSGHTRPHHFDRDPTPNGPVSANTGLKPK